MGMGDMTGEDCSPGGRVAISGDGGLGQMAILYDKELAFCVIGMDSADDKLEFAPKNSAPTWRRMPRCGMRWPRCKSM